VLLEPLVGRARDGGAAVALASGWVGLSWLLWLGGKVKAWSASPATASAVFLLLIAAAGAVAWRRRATLGRTLTRRRRGMALVLVVWVAFLALFLAIRLGNPAIAWGEKPMDFTFLNAFLRAPAWPPGEPWLAGLPLHYYYFGEILAAVPIQLAGASGAVGYNLVVAAIPAFSAALLAAFGLAIARGRLLGGVLLPVLALLLGNLAWLVRALDPAREATLFDLWWATSRVIPGFAIDEYPLWTAVFADLHAHFLAAPVILLAAAWGWLAVRAGRRWPLAAAACGVATGVLAATNPWDVLTLTALLLAAAAFGARSFPHAVGRLALAAGISVVAVLPFLGDLARWTRAGTGGRCSPRTPAGRSGALRPVPRAAAAWAGSALGRLAFRAPAAARCRLSRLPPSRGSPSPASVLAAATWRSRELPERLAGGLAATGLLLVALCERFTLVDRMNTLFKIYNGVWYALAVALALLLASRLRPTRRLAALTALPLAAIAAVNLPIAVWQGWAHPRVISPRPTLDGRAYLKARDQQSWRVIRALEAVAGPNDVVAEAAGASYGDFTRVAMNTGIPTVVGWEFHLIQRGQSQAEIRARFDDLERLYRLPGAPEAREVLDRLDVRWVVVTDLERRTYGMAAADLFASVPGLLRVVDHEGAQLYRVMPTGRTVAGPVTPLGPEVAALDRLALPDGAAVSALTLGPRGAVVTIDDGSIAIADSAGQLGRTVDPPPCPAIGVEGERGCARCRDGRLYRREQQRWSTPTGAGSRRAGRVARAAVWFQRPVPRRADGRWIRLVAGPVAAAAASPRVSLVRRCQPADQRPSRRRANGRAAVRGHRATRPDGRRPLGAGPPRPPAALRRRAVAVAGGFAAERAHDCGRR
jgi:uncharacterized membrane protein